MDPAASISSAIFASMALYCNNALLRLVSVIDEIQHATNLLEHWSGCGSDDGILDQADSHDPGLAKLLGSGIKLESPA